MNLKRYYILALMIMVVPVYAAEIGLSDTEIRKRMIEESIAAYPGNCPCPYNRARNGSRCGKRSAWSRPGGRTPLCYESDIPDKMVNRYRAKR